mmetsp:Transcript_37305/g.42617  ORF Transcript_37305/g.42617 Transcript_37305/m.42617 type:complete len:215 (-) Transcript_37305:343-987(-)
MLPQIRWMVLVFIPSVNAFEALIPRGNRITRKCVKRELVMNPSDIISSGIQMNDHSSWESLLTTFNIATLKLEPAHGYLLSLSKDASPYLQGTYSTPLLEKGIQPFPTDTSLYQLPPDLPSFDPIRNPTPLTKEELTEITKTDKYIEGIGSKLPFAVLIAASVDFFLLSPGVDAFGEEVIENREEINDEITYSGGVRLTVISFIMLLTILCSQV